MTRREYQIQAFNRLLTIMDELRSKCPWDKKQTMESLMPLTIEETYELTVLTTQRIKNLDSKCLMWNSCMAL